MTVGLSAARANSVVDDLSGDWLKLHTGDPGANGTANAATETSRKQITLNSASGGSATNSNLLEWTSIAGSEDPTHFSLWSASTGGTFEGSGTITSDPYTAGDTFQLQAGDVTVQITTVAA